MEAPLRRCQEKGESDKGKGKDTNLLPTPAQKKEGKRGVSVDEPFGFAPGGKERDKTLREREERKAGRHSAGGNSTCAVCAEKTIEHLGTRKRNMTRGRGGGGATPSVER